MSIPVYQLNSRVKAKYVVECEVTISYTIEMTGP